MSRVWPRIVSIALAALLALAVGVVSARARTVGEFIDDFRITTEVTTKLTAESPSNFLKIDVKTESGIVTLSGAVDSYEKRSKAAQIAGSVNGVKGLVNNIQVAGTAPPPSSPPGAGTSSTSSVDATGTVASVDASSGTITLSDGRVLLATDRSVVYQPTTAQALSPATACSSAARRPPPCERPSRASGP